MKSDSTADEFDLHSYVNVTNVPPSDDSVTVDNPSYNPDDELYSEIENREMAFNNTDYETPTNVKDSSKDAGWYTSLQKY